MSVIVEAAREIPVIAEADVVVCGAGAAGFAAALTAAREGARTVLAERLFAPGGMMTSGLMSIVTTAHLDLRRGLQGKLLALMNERGILSWDPRHLTGRGLGFMPFDPEEAKALFDELLVQAGVSVLFGTTVVAAAVQGARVDCAIVENKGGRGALRGRVFIDATGDGDLGFHAGAELAGGGRGAAGMLAFRVANVDVETLLEAYEAEGYPYANENDRFLRMVEDRLERAAEEHDFSEYQWSVLADGAVNLSLQPKGRQVLVNAPRIVFDGTDAVEVSAGMIEGRRQARVLLEFLQRFMPGFEEAMIVDTAEQIGVGESRRILGDYVLTAEDILDPEGGHFPDAVARNTAGLPPDVSGAEEATPAALPPGQWYDIPFRCLVARGRENLLMAGRCISATAEALSSARSIGLSLAEGEAAGAAAALAAAAGVGVRDVPFDEIRSRIGIGEMTAEMAEALDGRNIASY